MSEILDSGERRTFGTGAVRDIQEGKGRCDLLPLDVVGGNYGDSILLAIAQFQECGDPNCLAGAVDLFVAKHMDDWQTAMLELAKHYEEGAKKYAEGNWKLGINTKHYIDSGVRHYLKFMRGDEDEPHDRAFLWNMLSCIWTCKHLPELNDYAKKENDNG